MSPDPTRKTRRCGPKVRSGCGTCKIRRVKCDEAHPACKRCSSTGRHCDGYNSPAQITKAGNGQSVLILQRVSTYVPGSGVERRGYNYFLTNTAPELSGYFSAGFWEGLILQAAHQEPALRHAVIAIGSLHETFAHKKLNYSVNHGGFAVEQYAKAIKHLRRSLASGSQAPVTALMSCILFVCFDSVLGRFSSAMVHLQSGLRIIRDVRFRATCSAADEFLIENTIAPLFMRLSLQAILYIDTRSAADRRAFSFELMKTNEQDMKVPECFETLEEARNNMCQSAEGIFRMFYMCDGDLPFSYQPAEAMELHTKYTQLLAEWNISFEKFMNAKGKDLDSRELRGAVLLKIQHTTIKIMADISPSDMDETRSCQEVANDPNAFLPLDASFITIVKLCRSLISAAELDAKAGKFTLTFSIDTGVIAPLYYVCTHSQSKEVREAALELLVRCHRREGMWDSQATARMVKEFWLHEERHKVLQERSVSDTGIAIALSEVLDLEMYDGMQWEWRWKVPKDSSTSLNPNRPITWTEALEDEKVFEGFYEHSDSVAGQLGGS